MDKFFTATGNIRRDHFGRIVIDTCPSDLDHNRDSKTDPVKNRPLCRGLVEEAFGDFIGKKGTLTLTISLREEAQSALPVSEMTDETTRKVMDTGPSEKKASLSKSALEMSVVAALEHVDGNKKKLVSFAESQWETLWKPLVTTKGRIDKAKLMTELADFSILMEEAGKVYHHVTGGQINTVRVMATDVINAATEADNEALKEILADEKGRWEQERGARDPVVERLEDVCYVRLGNPTAMFEGRHVHITIPGGTYSAAWCSETDQLLLSDDAPLPADWVDTAKEAARALLTKEI